MLNLDNKSTSRYIGRLVVEGALRYIECVIYRETSSNELNYVLSNSWYSTN
jgi:hypothetical protein